MYRISVIEMQEMSRMDLTNSEEYRKYIVYVNKKENVLFEQNSADENKTNILLRCVTPEEFLMNMLDEMEKTSLHQDLMTRLHVQDIRRVLEKFWELWQVVTSKDFDLKECYRNVIEQYYNDAGEPIDPEFDFDKRYEVVLEEFLRHKGVKERHIND